MLALIRPRLYSCGQKKSQIPRFSYIQSSENWILVSSFASGAEKNFQKASDRMIDSRGVEYGYGSIMHYSKYAGNNRPGLVTIQPLDSTVELGQLKGPSKLDIKQARLMYECGKCRIHIVESSYIIVK